MQTPTTTDATKRLNSPDQAWSGLRTERCSSRQGFTLLEVILALAILGLALATLGQAVGRSHQSARQAATETELNLIAQSVLDELLTGVRPLTPLDGEPIADPTDPLAPPVATVSVAIDNGPLDGLLAITVRAQPANEPSSTTRVEFVRWLVDPSLTETAETGL